MIATMVTNTHRQTFFSLSPTKRISLAHPIIIILFLFQGKISATVFIAEQQNIINLLIVQNIIWREWNNNIKYRWFKW